MKPIYTQKINWKGEDFVNELYITGKLPERETIKQVQAVCINENKKIIIYENKEGFFGIPGGKLKSDETIENALRREINEESSSKMESYKVIGYVKSFKASSPKDYTINVRCLAKVTTLNKEISDPAGKAVRRLILDPEEAIEKLSWGEIGEILVKVAIKKNI